jgi:putative membrane-bound dehydrogenase-like protein
MYRLALLALLALPALAGAQPQRTHQVKLNGHTFTLPEGFTIEVAAGADLAPRPIVAAFDEKGRLYVCDSSGSNEKVTDQVKKKPHRILRLESTKGDGKFDKQTVFVKNVMFPEGCMWRNGSLYVAAPPHIWRFTDTNDDGVADKEEIWFDGKTLTGCANDLHGPYPGPDGRIYWCKGAFAKQEHLVPVPPHASAWTKDSKIYKDKFVTRAAHIFRARPNGGELEPVMTGGMDNPVDVVFTPTGDLIFSTTFFQHPGGGKRDGLIHAIYGGVYGKDHNVLEDHPWTGPQLMPVLTHMGPAAPCGLHRYENTQFGKEYENNVFCCQFNMRKVSRHVLVPKGSTYETKDSDFVVSDNLDFHPTDVIEDADGSLLIVDTGGWYKLCCPTSQLVKPDVTGAIYRVKRVGAHKVDDPRGSKIDWKKLDAVGVAKLLDDPRPCVQKRAIEFAAVRSGYFSAFDVIVSALAANLSERGVRNAIWVAARVGPHTSMAELIRALTLDARAGVRQTALQVISLWREPNGTWYARRLLADPSPAVRRVAAEAVGRLGNNGAIPYIFEALEDESNDRALDHALTFALIEIADADETAEGLKHKSLRVRRACLAALEFMPGGRLEPGAVISELDSKDPALRETAWWIAGRHKQWGAALADSFRAKLNAADRLTPAERDELIARMTKFAENANVQKVLGAVLAGGKPAPARLALSVMARSGLKALPDAWVKALDAMAPDLDDRDTLRAALGVFRAVPADAKDYDAFVVALPRAQLWPGGAVPEEFRLGFLAARPAGQPLSPDALRYLVRKLDRDEDPADRATAADVLVRAKLTPAQFAVLAAGLKSASPLELPKLIGAFGGTKDQTVGMALVAVLQEKNVRAVLRTEMVKPILDKYPPAVTAAAEKLYAELAEARKGETARLEKMLADMAPGDIRRGQLVFNSAKTNCIACHKVGYVGGTAGPDLTKIGGIRSERDLLESIIYPSASFVRSYEPYRVVTKDERTFNGVLKKDAPDEIVIVVAADREERIARADIESIAPSTISLMPAGLEQQLTPQEIADLLAFLKACR